MGLDVDIVIRRSRIAIRNIRYYWLIPARVDLFSILTEREAQLLAFGCRKITLLFQDLH